MLLVVGNFRRPFGLCSGDQLRGVLRCDGILLYVVGCCRAKLLHYRNVHAQLAVLLLRADSASSSAGQVFEPRQLVAFARGKSWMIGDRMRSVLGGARGCDY